MVKYASLYGMSTDVIPTAAALIIGNEILSGRTQDANLNTIAKKLFSIGIPLREARVVPDIETDIVKAVNELRAKYTYVFTTGGIGPTHDDITADAVGKAFGLPVSENAEARARLMSYYTETSINTARLRMARMPQGAVLIDNPVSAAPGFRIENVYVLAGVPGIMTAMLDNIAAQLRHGPAIHSIALSASLAESMVAEDLRIIAESWPQLDIRSYPWFRAGKYGTSLVVRGIDKAEVQKASDQIFALVEKRGGQPEIEISPSAA